MANPTTLTAEERQAWRVEIAEALADTPQEHRRVREIDRRLLRSLDALDATEAEKQAVEAELREETERADRFAEEARQLSYKGIELKADRDQWKARAERAEARIRAMIDDEPLPGEPGFSFR